MLQKNQKFLLLIIYLLTALNIAFLIFSLIKYYYVKDTTGIFIKNLLISFSIILLAVWTIKYNKIQAENLYRINLFTGLLSISFYLYKIFYDLFVFFTYS